MNNERPKACEGCTVENCEIINSACNQIDAAVKLANHFIEAFDKVGIDYHLNYEVCYTALIANVMSHAFLPLHSEDPDRARELITTAIKSFVLTCNANGAKINLSISFQDAE